MTALKALTALSITCGNQFPNEPNISVPICVIVTMLSTPGWLKAGKGFYLSTELGVNFAPTLNTIGGDNDRASRYDEYINPNYATTKGYNPNQPGIGDSWKNEFDSAEGILAGMAFGYRMRDRYPDHLLNRRTMLGLGFDCVGGDNSPYVWVNMERDSWSAFDLLLNEAGVVSTPGAGFGKCGQGHIRLSAFNSYENVEAAMERIAQAL